MNTQDMLSKGGPRQSTLRDRWSAVARAQLGPRTEKHEMAWRAVRNTLYSARSAVLCAKRARGNQSYTEKPNRTQHLHLWSCAFVKLEAMQVNCGQRFSAWERGGGDIHIYIYIYVYKYILYYILLHIFHIM